MNERALRLWRASQLPLRPISQSSDLGQNFIRASEHNVRGTKNLSSMRRGRGGHHPLLRSPQLPAAGTAPRPLHAPSPRPLRDGHPPPRRTRERARPRACTAPFITIKQASDVDPPRPPRPLQIYADGHTQKARRSPRLCRMAADKMAEARCSQSCVRPRPPTAPVRPHINELAAHAPAQRTRGRSSTF